MTRFALRATAPLLFGAVAMTAACVGDDPSGLGAAPPARTTVLMDFFHQPNPEIPLPNDLATRPDPTSATGLRLNASLIRPSYYQSHTRELLDRLDGWATFQPISVPFTGPLDVENIVARHADVADQSDDVIYLIDVDPDSPDFGAVQYLDVGNGNYPVVLENPEKYGRNDPRGWTMSLFYEEADEDLNGNGRLDPGEDTNRNGALDPGEDLDGDGVLDPPEDTDADGVLDVPNYLPGMNPARDDLAGRADALMYFYERQSNTLMVRPMLPLRERTTYAVVVTRRLLDEQGDPVGSPYPFINHNAQTADLAPLAGVLASQSAAVGGLTLDDVAFAFTFTTQSVSSDWIAVREGLYGHGVQGHLGREFPAELEQLFPLWNPELEYDNPYIIYTEEWMPILQLILQQLFGLDSTSEAYRAIVEHWQYVDYQVMGTFEAPQLFERFDADGNPLSWNDQSWPADLHSVPAEARPERISFWLTVPRREVSARGEGRPAPIAIMAHGYLSNRLELLPYTGFFAKAGFATLAIDDVSHGVDIAPSDAATARTLAELFQLGPLFDALLTGRASDLNGDGQVDSGGDFWSAYLFHNRDNVRQSLLDHVHMVRIFRSFDGVNRWALDVNGDGEPELAGDFDGDGVVDVGGPDNDYVGIGGSLGGLMVALLGALEPPFTAVTPVSGGAGLFDVAQRSHNPGVPEAVVMRLMGPIHIGTLDATTGRLLIETQVPNLARLNTIAVGTIEGVLVGDTILLENVDNGTRGCGYVAADGTVRMTAESDAGDRLRILAYRGPALVLGSSECELEAGLEPYATLSRFEADVDFMFDHYDAGDPIVALIDGAGLRRADPELRRTFVAAQIGGQSADPSAYARHFHDEPLVYPYTGEVSGSQTMIVTTLGDMAVPTSAGVSLARAAGLLEFLEPDPAWGMSPNDVLVENYVTESVHTMNRFTYGGTPEGAGVHIDVENFSRGTDMWGANVPRLDPPLHQWSREDADGNDRGGISGAIFPYPVPEGQHGFPFPGDLTDRHRRACLESCPEDGACCDDLEPFDTGNFLFNSLGWYMRTGAQEFNVDMCNSRNDCEWFPEPPAARRTRDLRE
jgi:hypothetical protein